MTDHLCITKMKKYLQWIPSFLYELVILETKHSFFFSFSYLAVMDTENLSEKDPIFYITIK